MADSSEIDNAVIQRLQSDAPLKAILPDGVYVDVAPPGSQRFVLVSVLASFDEHTFDGRAIEDVTYQIKAVALLSDPSVGAPDMKGAAARIDALFEGARFAAPGYGEISAQRTERVRMNEADDRDPSIRWQHRGGQYRVLATPANP